MDFSKWKFYSLFSKEEIDLDILKEMSHIDLQMIGIKAFGNRFKILKKIKQLSEEH